MFLEQFCCFIWYVIFIVVKHIHGELKVYKSLPLAFKVKKKILHISSVVKDDDDFRWTTSRMLHFSYSN